MDLADRRRLADQNVTAAFDLVRVHRSDPLSGRHRFGAVDVIAVGAPLAFFNPVLALDPTTTAADLRAAIEWVRGRGLPHSVQLRDDLPEDLRTLVAGYGLVQNPWPTPVMVLDPVVVPAGALTSFDIRVGGGNLFEDFHAAIGSIGLLRELFSSGLLDDERVAVAVAYLDNEPVSAATAVRSNAAVGIYAVATAERARRQGFGRAVTWAVIEAGRERWASAIAVLQASEMGAPLYRSMGFDDVSRYLEFGPPPTPPSA